MLDYSRTCRRPEFEALLTATIRRFYLADRNAPLDYEPSGEDFLSPCLGQADVVRRVLSPADFAPWLAGILPGIPEDGSAWLLPVETAARADAKLGHWDGLNLSRAWMLRGVASSLPAGDNRIAALGSAADEHARAGLAAISDDHYEGAHWLGTFATYLLTGAWEAA